jgi:hypothetical protein
MSYKQGLMNAIDDTILDLLYYDRKEDEELPKGAIEQMIKSGEVSVQDIVDRFEEALRDSV